MTQTRSLFLAFSHLKPRKQTTTTPAPATSNYKAPTSFLEHALSITEILEVILSFLSLEVRRISARWVCKQWYFICKHLIPASYTWTLRLTPDKPKNNNGNTITGDKNEQDLVSAANNITIKVDNSILSSTSSEQRQVSWKEMMRTLSGIVHEHNQRQVRTRLRSLHLKEGILENFAIQLSLLPRLTTLTTLMVDNIVRWDVIHLFPIFRACPNLKELTVKPTLAANIPNKSTYFTEYQSCRITVNQENARISGDQTLPALPQLQSCRLYNVAVTLPALGAFLQASPRLSTLVLARCSHLMRWGPDTPYLNEVEDPIQTSLSIIQLVGTRCPNLKIFHLSMPRGESYGLGSQEVVAILETFPHMVACNITNETFDPLLLKAPSMAVVNRVTTLNLFPTQSTNSITPNILLRKILCTFEHLLHLRAPTAIYFIEDMDLRDVREQLSKIWKMTYADYSTNRRLPPTPANDAATACRYIWVCRGLRTLHMTVHHSGSDTSYPENDLIVFGFLSRMCPRLQELHLRRWGLSLSFQGGLPLLSRLEDLEHVRISTENGLDLNEESIAWLHSTPPSTWDRLTYKLLHHRRRTYVEIQKRYKELPSALESPFGSEIVKRGQELGIDLINLGHPEDLLEWVNGYYGANTNKATNSASHRKKPVPALPKLRSFWIECPLKYLDGRFRAVEDMMALTRPDVDFRVRQDLEDVFYDLTLEHY
ncbi:hypothetical protein BGX24_008117 [Mortierella sp. AD032]|nr:hypothetical protein BGX24_008117 [Mortierella sp. AD032]